MVANKHTGADAGFFKGGVKLLSLPAKGGGLGGPALGLNVKPTSRAKRGGQTQGAPPPRSATVLSYLMENLIGSLESSRV